MLIKLSDSTIWTEQQFRAAHPDTMFPAVIDAQVYADAGFAVVFPAPAPAHDPITHTVREIASVLTVKGTYEQQWEVVALDAATVSANQAAAAIAARNTLIDAVQRHLDDTARLRNYDGILSACSYATDTHPPFQAEGQACVNWRGAVWLTCYQIMAEVQAGTRVIPTEAELIALLPPMVWPA